MEDRKSEPPYAHPTPVPALRAATGPLHQGRPDTRASPTPSAPARGGRTVLEKSASAGSTRGRGTRHRQRALRRPGRRRPDLVQVERDRYLGRTRTGLRGARPPAVRQVQVVGGAQRVDGVGPAGGMHAGAVAEEGRAPGLVQGGPVRHPVVQGVGHQGRVLAEAFGGVPGGPAAAPGGAADRRSLQLLWEVPVVERGRRAIPAAGSPSTRRRRSRVRAPRPAPPARAPVSPRCTVPGVRLKVSPIDGVRPPSPTTPSIWYAEVALPHRKPGGKRRSQSTASCAPARGDAATGAWTDGVMRERSHADGVLARGASQRERRRSSKK